MIEHPTHTRRALLAWQRPLGGNERRDRHAVAELVQVGSRLSFRYLDDDELEPARQAGFTVYPGLPFDSSNLGQHCRRGPDASFASEEPA